MKEQLIARLKKSEENLKAYEEFRKNAANPQPERNAVAFAELFELFAFTAIHELIPDYIPSRSTQVQVAQSFGGALGYVTVVDGAVKVSPEYHEFMARAQELKNKKN